MVAVYDVLNRIDGKHRSGTRTDPILDKFSEEPVGTLHVADEADIDDAIGVADKASADPLPSRARSDYLRNAAARIEAMRAEFCAQMRSETGFSLADANREVDRAADTLTLCADEAIRLCGEEVPLGSASPTGRRLGFTLRKPVGVVAAITPFNSPLNTVCHKVGPALAAGNAVIVKPASQSPSCAVALADAFFDVGLPGNLLQVVNGPGNPVGSRLAADPRVAFIAFTGSTPVGVELRKLAGLRSTQLELGSISCTVIDGSAEIRDRVIDSCVSAAFRKAGQVCTSIQRLYVHESVEEQVRRALLVAVSRLRSGDPKLDETDIGPLISRGSAERLESWIAQAAARGAEVLTGGARQGTLLRPTVLAGLGPGMHLHDEEAFGPVLGLYRYSSDDEVIDEINGTPYGLATGLFTRDLNRAFEFASRLRVGTVYVNGTSSNRVDLMPYGGLKESGQGREGPAYSVREMSVETLVSIEWSGTDAL